ncbi:MAG: DUF29 domain-containing protein [Methylococcaceae bacterium]|nr:MAG: DUF29 domain-containing protein [Methylococcaceae bacterium]
MTTVAYEFDVIAWAQEQAALLRSGQFNLLDIEHIADEVEDVGKSEQREFENRMAVLLAHLLKWQYQSSHRGASWERTIKEQRKRIALRVKKTPSLQADLRDPEWWFGVWSDAVSRASEETRLTGFPEMCPWGCDQIMDTAFWPSDDVHG